MPTLVCPLSVLEPELLKIIDEHHWRHDAIWGDADGLWFLCPKCWLANGRSAIGTHHIVCWQPHVSQSHTPRPGRWKMAGTSLADVSLVAGSSSIKLTSEDGCKAHFFIRNGRVEDLEGYKG